MNEVERLQKRIDDSNDQISKILDIYSSGAKLTDDEYSSLSDLHNKYNDDWKRNCNKMQAILNSK